MPRPQLKRADAKAKAEAAGATVGGDVTGKTTLVVNGGDGGAKLEKAKAKGIEIWDEASFMAAIGGGSSSSTAAAATTSGGGKKKKAEAPAEEPAAKKPKGKGKGKEAAPPPPPAAPPASKPSGGGGGRVRKPDRSVPDGGMYAVHEDYDVKLNQTNIGGGQNNNKFYIIQVLESGGQYFAWNRWGRVGEEGQHKMEACGTAAAAIKSFEKKFKDKTKNTWTSGASRDQFVKHDGKYQLVDVEDDDGGDGAALGKLSAEQIGKGQEVLEQIKAALNGEGGNVAFLSGQFYSLIPTQTGRTAPPAIADFGMLAEKEHQLDFWLRMGFEDMTQTLMDNPLEKMRDEPPPPTLQVAAGGVCDKMAIGQSQQRGQALEKAQAVRCAKGGSNAGLAAPAPLPSPSPARPGPFGALASVAGQAEQEDERRAVRGHRALHGQLHLPRA
jgi:predicted DNA-binding WGR domain protein